MKHLDNIPKVASDLQYMQYNFYLTQADIQALLDGKYIEIEVNEGEYQVYLSLDRNNNEVKSIMIKSEDA